MSEKSLGQIARDAFFGDEGWDKESPMAKAHFERAAQAVADELQSKFATATEFAKQSWLRQGAAEERERLAKIHDDKAKELAALLSSPFDLGSSEEPFSRAYREHKSEAAWLRAGGKT